MTCYPIINPNTAVPWSPVVGHLCTTGASRELKREHAGVKWCFACRAHLPHDWVLFDTVEPSYHGPWCRYDCSRCHQDRTCFPGCEREWDYA